MPHWIGIKKCVFHFIDCTGLSCATWGSCIQAFWNLADHLCREGPVPGKAGGESNIAPGWFNTTIVSRSCKCAGNAMENAGYLCDEIAGIMKSKVCYFTSYWHLCLPTDGVGELALRQLPGLLPPTTYKVGRGRGAKVVRHTNFECSLAFIDHKAVSPRSTSFWRENFIHFINISPLKTARTHAYSGFIILLGTGIKYSQTVFGK